MYIKAQQAISRYDKEESTIILKMRKKEIILAKKIGEMCFQQLLNNGYPEIEIKDSYNKLNSINNNFLEGMKGLNKLFVKYSKLKFGSIIDENGYYNIEEFMGKEDIKKEMDNAFNEFIRIFTSESNGDIAKKHFAQSEIEKNFITQMNSFVNKQKEAEAQGNWEMAALYEGIIQYCNGRGVSLINYLNKTNNRIKKKETFEQTRERLSKQSGNLKDLISTSSQQNVHTAIRDKDESIRGSFEASLKSPNKGGIILEYLDKLLLTEDNVLKIGQKSIAINTGKKLNVLKKSQKNDLIVTFGLKEKTPAKGLNKKKMNGKNTIISTNVEQLGISVKNYKKGQDISVHTGGTLNTITNFLKTYNKLRGNGINDFCKLYESAVMKYYLINEIGYKNSNFIEALKETLASQGAIFTLTPFLLDTKDGLVDESVDFFLIDQILIPGSLIMEYTNKAKALGMEKGNHSVTKNIGFTVKISGERPDDNEIINDGTGYVKKKNEDFPYSDHYLQYRNKQGLNRRTYDKIKFTIEMRESFKKNLQRLISDIK